MIEIAKRNALQRSLESHFHSAHWYDVPACWHMLTSTQQDQINGAKQNLQRQNKNLTPGRIVSELTFGFWTAFFNKRAAQNRDAIRITARAFHGAPKSQRDIRFMNRCLTLIRELRNRVFHHERIIHWADLDSRHAAIMETLGWISSELQELAIVLNRFPVTRMAGTQPWIGKLRRHWPDATVNPTATAEAIAIIEASFEATNGVETPFGHRWGGDVFTLSSKHLEAMQSGQTVALDVMNEYVVFLKAETDEGISPGKGFFGEDCVRSRFHF